MKKLGVFVLIFLMSLFFVSGSCKKDQIDINSASISKLDELSGIGPVKAEAIIDERPFDSLDDLIEVHGIGEVTLEKIKDQGLACVEEEDDEEEEKEEEKDKEEEEYNPIHEEIIEEKKDEKAKIEIIKLNPKDIKSENNIEDSNKSVYAKYGLGIFCILLGFLFILKKQKNYKTEFE